MRVVAFDIGLRRTGVAISDPSGTLARPWRTVPGANPRALSDLAASLKNEEDGLEAIVIGLPRRLDGSPTSLTSHVMAVAEALRAMCAVPVVLQDERLTSVEAEGRLAARDKDWRSRKEKLDAASAAIILQDYLDSRAVHDGEPAPDADSP